MTKTSKLKRLARQEELLKNFTGDFYQEKKIGNEWYVKSFNGSTGRWQVSVFSEKSFRGYKSFSESKNNHERFYDAISDD